VADPYAPHAAAPPTTAYANWGQRVLAYLIDALPPGIVGYILLVAFNGPPETIVVLLVIFGWLIFNRWYLGGTTGQSIGKKVLNIRLVSDETGQPIGMLMAFVRDVCHIVDSIICYVGWLVPLWDSKRQTLADKIMRTVVVFPA
jgi:uncharacterized RDD family membrane protein YckC